MFLSFLSLTRKLTSKNLHQTVTHSQAQAQACVHDSAQACAHDPDKVFGQDCTSQEVYEEGAKTVALSALTGMNATIFAYGQTSSGKTFTIRGITENAIKDRISLTSLEVNVPPKQMQMVQDRRKAVILKL